MCNTVKGSLSPHNLQTAEKCLLHAVASRFASREARPFRAPAWLFAALKRVTAALRRVAVALQSMLKELIEVRGRLVPGVFHRFPITMHDGLPWLVMALLGQPGD